MKNLFAAGRFLLQDLASTLLFFILYVITDNLLLSVGIGMALGVAQIVWALARRQTIGTMQWMSVVLVLASGAATLLTHDARFVMLKPSIIYSIVGAVMMRRGWMTRYLPPRAESVKDVATSFGYAWAVLMFFSAALNLALALSLEAKACAAIMFTWGIASKLALFLIQYAVMTSIGKRRAALATRTA
jgi:intracellular septation protein